MPLKPFIVDCDTGRDDALLLWCALTLKLPLAGVIASYGNVAMTSVLDNTARVLALGGREDIPLFAGASRPSRRHAGYENVVAPRQKKSGNGLANVHLPRVERKLPEYGGPGPLAESIEAVARDNKGPVDYILIGPATNLAAICGALGGKTKEVIGTVTMMGGKFQPLWDQIPGADFNVLADPYALRAILDAGVGIRFVPMNATYPIALDLPDVQALVASSEIGKWAQEIMVAHCRHFAPEPVFRFHDPAVLMAALAPESFYNEKLDVNLDETSADFGRLLPVDDGYPVQLYSADEAMRAKFLNGILSALGLSPA